MVRRAGATSEIDSASPSSSSASSRTRPRCARGGGGAAGQPRGRGDRGPAPEEDRHRRQRAGARRHARARSRCTTACKRRRGPLLHPRACSSWWWARTRATPTRAWPSASTVKLGGTDLDGGGHLRRGRQRVRLRGLVRRQPAQPDLPAPGGHPPVRDRAPHQPRRAGRAADAASRADPRMRVRVERETDYYQKASQMMTTFIACWARWWRW